MDLMSKGSNFVLALILFFLAFLGLWMIAKPVLGIENQWTMLAAAILAAGAVAGK